MHDLASTCECRFEVPTLLHCTESLCNNPFELSPHGSGALHVSSNLKEDMSLQLINKVTYCLPVRGKMNRLWVRGRLSQSISYSGKISKTSPTHSTGQQAPLLTHWTTSGWTFFGLGHAVPELTES